MLPIMSRPMRPMLTRPFSRLQSTYQPPNAPASKPSPHSNFYKVFGRPLAKTFLIAVATYQVLYWSWAKLESIEAKHETEQEIKGLQGELRSLTGEGR